VNKSDSIANLAQALALFQGEVSNPKNSANNPFFKSKYAPLNEVINTVKPIMAKQGLSVLQSPSGDGERIVITTLLMHSSGEWIEGDPLILKADKVTAQGAGSAITYGRRYALSAILGITSEEDDDANHAAGNKEKSDTNQKPKEPDVKPQQNNQKPISWPAFWQGCKNIGFTQEEVHEFAKVSSIKDWDRSKLDKLLVDLKASKSSLPASESK